MKNNTDPEVLAMCGCSVQQHVMLHQLVSWYAMQLGTLHRLLRIFSSPERVFAATRTDLARARVREKSISDFFIRKTAFHAEAAHAELMERAAEGMILICRKDPRYPALLQRIAQPPLVLYVRGNADLLCALGDEGQRALGIVGSRAPSEHGLAATQLLAARAAHSGIHVVSGLALGIDCAAHEAVMNISGVRAGVAFGNTIAVLGGGITDRALSPPRNKPTAQRILQYGGTLISEYPFDMQSRAQFFPERNRIIAGMCSRMLVIEAAARSGSLITARHALEENRDVLAVPGELLNVKAAGTNALLAAGAQVIYSAEQFEEILVGDTPSSARTHQHILKKAMQHIEMDTNNAEQSQLQLFTQYTESDQHVLRAIHTTMHSPLPVTFTNLLDITKLPYEQLEQTLTLLELGGTITRELSGEYSIPSL